jgi:hypothetical protein
MNILKELEKVRIDCMYGKKKHYNARDRYTSYHRRMGMIVIGLTAFMGTSVFYSLSDSKLLLARVITCTLVVAIAVLTAIQTFLNFGKRALSHKVIADRYLWLMKESQRIIAYYKDGNKKVEELQKEIERLCQEVKNIQKDEPEVSQIDYQKARQGIRNGEEIYTDAERKK